MVMFYFNLFAFLMEVIWIWQECQNKHQIKFVITKKFYPINHIVAHLTFILMKILVVLFAKEIYIKMELSKYVVLKIITLFWAKVAYFAMVILMLVELFAVLLINILNIQFLELLVVYQIVLLTISTTLNIVAIV